MTVRPTAARTPTRQSATMTTRTGVVTRIDMRPKVVSASHLRDAPPAAVSAKDSLKFSYLVLADLLPDLEYREVCPLAALRPAMLSQASAHAALLAIPTWTTSCRNSVTARVLIADTGRMSREAPAASRGRRPRGCTQHNSESSGVDWARYLVAPSRGRNVRSLSASADVRTSALNLSNSAGVRRSRPMNAASRLIAVERRMSSKAKDICLL